MTHWSPTGEKPSPRWIAGRASVTMDTSMTTSSCASRIRPSAGPFLRIRLSAAPAVAATVGALILLLITIPRNVCQLGGVRAGWDRPLLNRRTDRADIDTSRDQLRLRLTKPRRQPGLTVVGGGSPRIPHRECGCHAADSGLTCGVRRHSTGGPAGRGSRPARCWAGDVGRTGA